MRDLRLRSPCSASPGKPPRIGRAIPRTSPLAETRSWTPPAAHPRSAAAETCPGAPESWVLGDYHEPAVFSYGWRPFSRHLAVIGDLRIQDCQHKRRFAFRRDLCHCAREWRTRISRRRGPNDFLETRINAPRMILPSHHPHLQTIVRQMLRPVPASTRAAALDRCTFQGLTTGRVSVSGHGITAPPRPRPPEPWLPYSPWRSPAHFWDDCRRAACPSPPGRGWSPEDPAAEGELRSSAVTQPPRNGLAGAHRGQRRP
jgi:hypothetical protein